MAIPNTKDTFKEYCLRALGKPVIDINVDPDQCDDRVDEALQYFAEYHMDGVERMYLKHKVTSAQKTRAVTNTSSNVTDTVDNSGGAYAWGRTESLDTYAVFSNISTQDITNYRQYYSPYV